VGSMSGLEPTNDLGNGVRPYDALGVNHPIWRLGALVSLPVSIGKVIMVQKPDRSLSLKDCLHASAGKTLPRSLLRTRPQRSTLRKGNAFERSRTKQPKGISTRPGYGSGPSRQGIARHVPPCPAALHLDGLALRQKCVR